MSKEYQIEQKLAASLTAETTELLPYLPYLLQDIYELGSSPRDMADLIKTYTNFSAETRVLDLGCGKGAVSLFLARELGIQAKGIDLIPEFISEAREASGKYGVEHLCQFTVQDINESVKTERGYDIVILGAVGDVLGEPAMTLKKLTQVIRKSGYILIDEAYLVGAQDEVRYKNYEYLTLPQWKKLFKELNLELIASKDSDTNSYADINDCNNRMIKNRASELAAKHPAKKHLFEGYVKTQEMECDDLDDTVIGVTWLLRSV